MELRKARKYEQIFKRRNIGEAVEGNLSPEREENEVCMWGVPPKWGPQSSRGYINSIQKSRQAVHDGVEGRGRDPIIGAYR